MRSVCNGAILLFVVLSWAGAALAQDSPGLPPPPPTVGDAFKAQKHYSPYAGRDFPTHVYWGDTHLHTGMSMDAGAFGARLTPDDAYLHLFSIQDQVEELKIIAREIDGK